MIRSFSAQVREAWCSLCSYYRREKALRWFTAILILFLYGIRLAYGDISIDSDIMLVDPDQLLFSWYGHQRFGLIFTKYLFSLKRLLPWQQSVLFVLTLWILSFTMCFCFSWWCGRDNLPRPGVFLFAGIFLTAPCLAEQFHFLLQAFESAVAMLLCVAAVFCAGQWIYDRKSVLWALPALLMTVWAFGSYQACPAFYIALVLASYLLVWLYQKEACGLRQGILHVLLFLAGFALSQLSARIFCSRQGASSAYVDHMFFWGVQPLQVCMANIWEDVQRIYYGSWNVFFSRWFRHMGLAASAFALVHGWQKKHKTFPCFLLALVLLPVTPLMITLITAMSQPIRSHLAYPFVYAFYALLLCAETVWITRQGAFENTLRKAVLAPVLAFGIVIGRGQAMTTAQLLETAHEQYVSDTLTANRIYADICRVADTVDPETCKVVFVGTRDSRIGGDHIVGDVMGYSFFQWDASGPVGISRRVNTFFKTLGLFMEIPEKEDYEKALELCGPRPSWPARDSIFFLDEKTIAVKLSEPLPAY